MWLFLLKLNSRIFSFHTHLISYSTFYRMLAFLQTLHTHLLTQSLLIENGKNLLVLYGDSSIETYFFVHPFGVSQGSISRFALLELKVDREHSVFRIPLSVGTKELQDIVAREIDADEPFTLERFITTFKISNIKNKPKQVFVKTSIEPSEAGAAVLSDVEENEDDAPVSVSMSLSNVGSSASGGQVLGKPPLL
jgi:hypothetical protein